MLVQDGEVALLADPRYRVIIYGAAYTDLRAGELLAFRLKRETLRAGYELQA